MPIKHIIRWYEKYERPISSFSLVGGFIFDAITLKRVDLFLENFFILLHIIVAFLAILLIHVFENHKTRFKEETYVRIHFWLLIIIQFGFGGLLSVYLVFYFRSGSLVSSWPFLLLLAAVFFFNERLKHHYSKLIFQICVLFISIYAFAIFIVPVIVHRIGPLIFLLSGAVSLVVLVLFLLCLRYIARERFQSSRNILLMCITGIFVLINVLYFTNLIPPIPLSLKDAGVYLDLAKDVNGEYVFESEPHQFSDYFTLYNPIHLAPFDRAYVYTAIFSPTRLNVDIVHQWQYYSEKDTSWTTITTTPLSIVGGRDEGFRTYSYKSFLLPGRWRVNVQTSRGQLIGRVRFEVKNKI